MKNIASKFLIVSFLVAISSVSCADILTESEAYIIVDKLLNMKPGESGKAELDRYRKWGSLYVDYWDRMKENPSDEEIKIYLMLVFTAYKSAAAETTEHISQTIVPIYRKNSDGILRVLSNHGFLVETTCYSIGSYFSNASSKEVGDKERRDFLNEYQNKIMEQLNRGDRGEHCLSQIK